MELYEVTFIASTSLSGTFVDYIIYVLRYVTFFPLTSRVVFFCLPFGECHQHFTLFITIANQFATHQYLDKFQLGRFGSGDLVLLRRVPAKEETGRHVEFHGGFLDPRQSLRSGTGVGHHT